VSRTLAALRRWCLRVYRLVRADAADRDLARELRSHLELLEDEFVRRGLPRDAARTKAHRELGGVERAK
jgi:hypothetical protein